MRERRHVLLATYGEPPTPSFLEQLAYSWRILLGLTRKVDAIPRPVLPIIALARARGRRQLWRAHAYGSPLEPITEAQAQALATRLAALAPGADWHVSVSYEYRHPLVGDAARAVPASEPVWVLPLYAADSAFTHALTRDAVEGREGPTYVLPALSPGLLGAISADHVRAHTEEPEWHGPDVALVLAAHGTVLDPPKPIDTGLAATEALCGDIRARLSDRFGLIVNGWLNHTRGGRWTEPPIDQALADVARAGFRRVVYYPYGFLGDNAESQLEGRVALGQTSLTAKHLPCLNDAPALLEVLARQVLACSATCHEAPVVQPSAARVSPCQRACLGPASAAPSCEICAPRAASLAVAAAPAPSAR